MSNVKGYTDKQLLDKVKSLPSFKGIPKDFWILGVQSDEDAYNAFDDKFYLFFGEKFIMVTGGTTNAGSEGIQNYQKYNKLGVLVVKTNEWHHGLWRPGLHKGKMRALKQVRNIKFYRDADRDTKIEEVGPMYEGLQGINFHTATYGTDASFIRKLIGGWSTGCQVINKYSDYIKILDHIGKQQDVSYCLLKEF